MSVVIRPITEADLDVVIDLGSNTPELDTGNDSPAFYSKNSLHEWMKDIRGVTLAAREKDTIVGFLLGQVMCGRDAYINVVVVDEPYREMGIATQLIETAERRFIEKGCNRVWFIAEEGNLAMLGLGKRLGYGWGSLSYKVVDKMIGE